MIEILLTIAGAAAGIFLAGVFAGAETAAYAASPVRIGYLALQGDGRARLMQRFLGNLARFVTLTLIGHNLAVYLSTFLIERQLSGRGISQAELWATLILTPFCFCFAETVPKHLGCIHGDRFSLAMAHVARASEGLFKPLAVLLGGVAVLLRILLQRIGFTPPRATRREEVLAHLEVSATEGRLSHTQHRMAANILNDIRRTASAVMTPMRAMPTVKKTATVRAAMELMRKSGCRALPVYDKRRHKVLGILTIESIIRGKACPDQPILDLAEPPVFVGADSPVARACAKLERAEAALAVVADETRALGIITVDDILDELIGEGEPGADVAARESAKG